MRLAPAEFGLHRKLVWLNLFRVATVTVLLGGAVIVARQSPGTVGAALAPIYAVVICTYGLSIAFAVALKFRVWLPVVAVGQTVVDVAIAAVVVSLTGRAESVFLFMFLLAIVNGAILLYRAGALVAAMLAIVGYFPAVFWAAGPGPRRLTVFVHCAAFVLTAVLASFLAEQLRETGERLARITGLHESIIQSMTSGLATLDLEGHVTYLNPAGEHMAGVRLGEILGRPAAQVFPSFEVLKGRGEIEHTTRGGQRMLLGYSSFALLGPKAAPMGTAVIFQDLTRLRTMEEAVARGERLADLGRVAAGLAHELRNPLAAISGSVELLRANASEDGDGSRLMDIVLKETVRLDALVTAFLEFARPAPVRRRAVDLAMVLEETLEVFAHDPAATAARIARDLRPALVECDPDQIRQVAWNLLVNAAQALAGQPDGGLISVTCAGLPEGGASFSIADDGPGIAPAELNRIFLPFHTTKQRGSGLGLATVHGIVDAHGGRIVVESEPGHGARFVVRLPPPGVASPAPDVGAA